MVVVILWGCSGDIGVTMRTDAGSDAGPPAVSCDYTSCSFAVDTSLFSDQPERATTDVLSVDLNRDGLMDLVWISQPGPAPTIFGGIDISMRRASGGFSNSVLISGDMDSWTFGDIADVNADGWPDLVVTRPARMRREVNLFLNSKDGKLVQSTDGLPMIAGTDPGLIFGRIAIADVNFDGHPDIYVPVFSSLDGTMPGKSLLLLGNGAGQFTKSDDRLPTLAFESAFTLCAVARDFTGDGAPDLFTGGGISNPRLLVSHDGGYFRDESIDDGTGRARVPDPKMRAYQCRAVDIDHDNDEDVAVVNDVGVLTDGGMELAGNFVYRNDGQGYFTVERLTPPPSGPFDSRAIAFSDLNGDGLLDVIVGNNGETVTHGGNAVEVHLQRPSGGFTYVGGMPSIADHVLGLAAADVNGDGLMDVVLAHSKQNEQSQGSLRNIALIAKPKK